MKKRNLFMKVILVVTAGVLIPSFSVAAGGVEKKPVVSSFYSEGNGGAVAAAVKSGGIEIWNGYLTGQAGSPVKTDFVKGIVSTTGAVTREAWNGCIIGQAGSPLKTDLAVLSAAKSAITEVRDGYLTGSFCPWQSEL